MDVLNVRLGPVLPHWPAGLVLRCGLQGDVIATAQAELLDGPRPSDPGTARQDHWARHLDNVASLLALAGWEDAAAEARGIRDAALRHGADKAVDDRLARLHRRVRRSRLLRWSLRGLRPLSADDVRRHRLPVDAIGDTYDRLTTMLQRAATGATGDDAEGPSRTGADGPRHEVGEHPPTWSTHHLAHLVTGLDLATARLVVASLDIHELRADHAAHEVSRA
jgi:hypothetical protein